MSQNTDLPVAPDWDELYERTEHGSTTVTDTDNLIGGVVVHRCHPQGAPEDFTVFAHRHETLSGHVEKTVRLYDGQHGGAWTSIGYGRWQDAVASRHVRGGSHQDCPVCTGVAEESALLREVVEDAYQEMILGHSVYGDRAVIHVTNTNGRVSTILPAVSSRPYVYLADVTDGQGRIVCRTRYPNAIEPAVV